MDPVALHELIGAIVRADLSNLLRRQSVCTIDAGEPPKPLFREIYVSIADLRDSIMPKRDIASDRWLFQYLTQTLDKRVLALLRKADDSGLSHAFSLNLNISTLLSPEFQAFDASLKAGARGSIVIEIEKVDVFADIGAFLFARDFVRERGYRLCLDGMTRLTLPFIDRAGLGLDLVKLFWSPDMADVGESDRQKEFLTAIGRVGKGRIILARCDTEQAIEFGLKSGIKLFQGRIIDKMLAANAGVTLTRNRLAAPRSGGALTERLRLLAHAIDYRPDATAAGSRAGVLVDWLAARGHALSIVAAADGERRRFGQGLRRQTGLRVFRCKGEESPFAAAVAEPSPFAVASAPTLAVRGGLVPPRRGGCADVVGVGRVGGAGRGERRPRAGLAPSRGGRAAARRRVALRLRFRSPSLDAEAKLAERGVGVAIAARHAFAPWVDTFAIMPPDQPSPLRAAFTAAPRTISSRSMSGPAPTSGWHAS